MTTSNQSSRSITGIYQLVGDLSRDEGVRNHLFTKSQIDQIWSALRKGANHEAALYKFNDMEFIPPDELMAILGLALMTHLEYESVNNEGDDSVKLRMFYQNLRDLLKYIQREIYNYDITQAMFDAMEN